MADLPVLSPDPLTNEGPLSKRQKLQFDENANEDKICLSDLHQCYIDKIAKYLNLKDVVRLQLTCHDLFEKCFNAQRLFTCPLKIDIGKYGVLRYLSRTWTEERLKATNCRFKASLFVNECFTWDVIWRVTDVLGGRLTLNYLHIHRFSPQVDQNIFSQFLQDFSVSHLNVREIPHEWLKLSAIKQLNYLGFWNFPLPLRYFLDSNVHSCSIGLDRDRAYRSDSGDMRRILQKWVQKEKVVKRFQFGGFNWNQRSLFFGWCMIKHGEEIPPERPLVIRTVVGNGQVFRVIRSDGASLWMKLVGSSLTVTDCDPRR